MTKLTTDLLRAGNVEEWNKCRTAGEELHSMKGANLSGADLSGANLSYADLSWANLIEITLDKKDLNASLFGALGWAINEE